MATESMLRTIEVIRSKKKCKALILALEAAERKAYETPEQTIHCEELRGEKLRSVLSDYLQ